MRIARFLFCLLFVTVPLVTPAVIAVNSTSGRHYANGDAVVNADNEELKIDWIGKGFLQSAHIRFDRGGSVVSVQCVNDHGQTIRFYKGTGALVLYEKEEILSVPKTERGLLLVRQKDRRTDRIAEIVLHPLTGKAADILDSLLLRADKAGENLFLSEVQTAGLREEMEADLRELQRETHGELWQTLLPRE